MTSELNEINDKLNSLIYNRDAQIRLVVQTGYDETGMVATNDGYLRLAQIVIEFLLKAEAKETETWDLYGHLLPGSTTINNVFRGNFEVCIDTLALANTQEEVNQVAQAFSQGSPLESLPEERHHD
ncbi:MAG: hypothetical protein V4671_25910 [Armatimonadota bacterium]